MGYSPWGRKESDTTERLHFPFRRMVTLGSKVTCLSPAHPCPQSQYLLQAREGMEAISGQFSTEILSELSEY